MYLILAPLVENIWDKGFKSVYLNSIYKAYKELLTTQNHNLIYVKKYYIHILSSQSASITIYAEV